MRLLLTRASVNALIRHLRGSGVRIDGPGDLDVVIERRHPSVGERLDDAADAMALPMCPRPVLDVPAVDVTATCRGRCWTS